ncbi:MAG: sulfatase-like hydrolase/transferase, partial [bacterium]
MTENGKERASASVGDAFLIAICFALVTGVSEAVTKTFRIFVLHRIIGVNQDFPWMAPLAYALFYLPIALILVVAFRIARRDAKLSIFVGIFTFLAVFALLLPYTELATIAEGFVAAGIAVQLYRLAKANPARARARIRTLTIALGALVVAVGGGATAWRAIVARNELGNLPAFTKGKPNVLLIIFDTVRRANVSLYGYPRPTTPEIERWARTGVVFDQAIAPAPWTLPTHASV